MSINLLNFLPRTQSSPNFKQLLYCQLQEIAIIVQYMQKSGSYKDNIYMFTPGSHMFLYIHLEWPLVFVIALHLMQINMCIMAIFKDEIRWHF